MMNKKRGRKRFAVPVSAFHEFVKIFFGNLMVHGSELVAEGSGFMTAGWDQFGSR